MSSGNRFQLFEYPDDKSGQPRFQNVISYASYNTITINCHDLRLTPLPANTSHEWSATLSARETVLRPPPHSGRLKMRGRCQLGKGAFRLSGVIALLIVMSGCAAHRHYYRSYDPYYRDY